jgi:hypothetical protein
VTYCNSPGGQKDVACWSFLPKSCPFLATNPGSPCNYGGGPVVDAVGAGAGAVDPAAAKAKVDAADKAVADAGTKVADAERAAATAAKAIADKANSTVVNSTVVVVADSALTKAKADADKAVTDAKAQEATAKTAAAKAVAKAKADADAAAASGAGKATADAAKIQALEIANAAVLAAGVAKSAADAKVATAKATADTADKAKIVADKAVADAAAASTATAPSPASPPPSSPSPSLSLSPSPAASASNTTTAGRRRLDVAADAIAATDAATKAGVALNNAKNAATAAQANFDAKNAVAVAAKTAVDAIVPPKRNEGSPAAKACGMMNAMGGKLTTATHAKEHACRSAIVGYCSSADGKMDPACWSLTPRKCPFSKTSGSAADAEAANIIAKNSADKALNDATKAAADADTQLAEAKKAVADAATVPAAPTAPSPASPPPSSPSPSLSLSPSPAASASNTTTAGRRRLDAALDTALADAELAATAAAAAVVKATSVATAAAAKVIAGVASAAVADSPCKSKACGLGTVKSAECRAAVVRWCTSSAGKGDAACWSILSKTTKCPFAVGPAAPGSPCTSTSCLGIAGTRSIECRATVVGYCHGAGKSDAACIRIPSGFGGGLPNGPSCPFNHDEAASTNPGAITPCFAPECGVGEKRSRLCRAAVIKYCTSAYGHNDPACRGALYRSQAYGAPTFVAPTPSVRLFKHNAADTVDAHNGFELTVKTMGAVTGGQWAVYENDMRPDAAYVVGDKENALANAKLSIASVTDLSISAAAAVVVAKAGVTLAYSEGAAFNNNAATAWSACSNSAGAGCPLGRAVLAAADAIYAAAKDAAARADYRLEAANTAKTAAGTAVATAKVNAPKAFGAGAYMTGDLAAFAASAEGGSFKVSLTRVESCTFMPTKTYWVYTRVDNTEGDPKTGPTTTHSRTSGSLRVQSAHDMSTLAPIFNKVINDPINIPAGWAPTDKLVGPRFKVMYELREDAADKGVDLKFTGKGASARTYIKYPHGSRRRMLRLVGGVGGRKSTLALVGDDATALVMAADKRRRTHGNDVSADGATSLGDRSKHAKFNTSTGFGMCGAHTYLYETPIMETDTYTVDIGYTDFHGHASARVVSYGFVVDTTAPVLAPVGVAVRNTVSTNLVDASFKSTEKGYVYWQVLAPNIAPPTAVSLAMDEKTLDNSGLIGRMETTPNADFVIKMSLTATSAPGAEYKLYSVAVDMAGNIGKLQKAVVPKIGTLAPTQAAPKLRLIRVFMATKTTVILDVRAEKKRKVKTLWWVAIKGTGEFLLPKPYKDQKWKSVIIHPASELFRVTLKGLTPGTAYRFWFATEDPTKKPTTPIVPAKGVAMTTIAADVVEYTGSKVSAIWGTKTTGFLMSVITGADEPSLTWALKKGDKEWDGDKNGMALILGKEATGEPLKGLVSTKPLDARLFKAGIYAGASLTTDGAGKFDVDLGAEQVQSSVCINNQLTADGITLDPGLTPEDEAKILAARIKGNCDVTMYYLPAGSSLILFETNPTNKGKDIKFSATMSITGYSSCTFLVQQKMAFQRVMDGLLGVSAGSCKVDKVADVVERKTPCPGGRRALALEDNSRGLVSAAKVMARKLAGENEIEIFYTVTLRKAADMARAQLVFEELKAFEDVMTDPALQKELIAAFTADGLTGAGGGGVAVTGASKPKSSHESGTFRKPSFGKDAKPLAPINPTVPGDGGGGTGTLTNPEIEGIVGGIIIFIALFFIALGGGFAYWWVNVRKYKGTGGFKPSKAKGGAAKGKKGGKGKDDDSTTGVELVEAEPQDRDRGYNNPLWADGDGPEGKGDDGEGKGDDFDVDGKNNEGLMQLGDSTRSPAGGNIEMASMGVSIRKQNSGQHAVEEELDIDAPEPSEQRVNKEVSMQTAGDSTRLVAEV